MDIVTSDKDPYEIRYSCKEMQFKFSNFSSIKCANIIEGRSIKFPCENA